MTDNWIERVTSLIAPRWHLQRMRAKVAANLIKRNYEGAAGGRRTQGWTRASTDAVRAVGPFTGRLRDAARNLVRNNAYAASAITTIVDHTVGWGITAKLTNGNQKARIQWKAWAETTACDADGRHDFAGLQKLVMRTVVESGECLVRRRFRRPEDGLPIPMQLQILEPDFLDSTKDTLGLPGGARIINGVEFDPLGRRVAYWLYPEHPGSAFATASSYRVPADGVLHVFDCTRPGQVRGPSWFAPVLVTFNDFDELSDATLMKQKIAACLAVITSDVDGSAAPLGSTDTSQDPQIDSLEPGMILNVPAGRSIEVVQPPSVREYKDYAATTLKAIAAGLGITYEDMANDYADLPFSAARMSRLRHQARVDDWRWRLLIPQFCTPVWGWFLDTAAIFGAQAEGVEWTAPPLAMIDPDKEGTAYGRNIRLGIQTLREALQERGYDPDAVLVERAADDQMLDDLGLILDSDPRQTTQQGQLQGKAVPKPAPAVPSGIGKPVAGGG